MKYIELYTGNDNKSHFKEVESTHGSNEPLGCYSLPYAVQSMFFREFNAGAHFDWHTAPRPQYIIYLEGEVEVETSSGEKCIFKAGDILFANDLSGEGHRTKTLSVGRSIVITAA